MAAAFFIRTRDVPGAQMCPVYVLERLTFAGGHWSGTTSATSPAPSSRQWWWHGGAAPLCGVTYPEALLPRPWPSGGR